MPVEVWQSVNEQLSFLYTWGISFQHKHLLLPRVPLWLYLTVQWSQSNKCCTGQFKPLNHNSLIRLVFQKKVVVFTLLIVSFCWWYLLLSHDNHLANNFLLPTVVWLPILSGLPKCWNWSFPLKLAVRWVSLACVASFMKKHYIYHFITWTIHQLAWAMDWLVCATCRHINTTPIWVFVIASHFVVMLGVRTFGASLICCL